MAKKPTAADAELILNFMICAAKPKCAKRATGGW